jgi:tripartite-type tricarboxylate transporter receptor subunit TctC
MKMRCLAIVLAFLASTVWAQTWPQKPVRVIVPFAPGGASDLMPRLVGEKLQTMWGQPVLMENRPGAAGNIGMEAGAKSPPDGYTLLSAPNGNLVVNPHMYSKLAYDVFKDLAPVTRISAVQNVLVVHPDVPASSVKELVALARAKPARSTSPRRVTAARRTWRWSS